MQYAYVGYSGERRVVKGKLSATNERAASDMLANVGYQVLSLKPVTSFLPDFSKLLRGKVKPAELITFSRQLALLLESGVGIVQSLELLGNQTSDRELRKVLIEVVADIRGGSSLSAALAKHPHVFSTLYEKMVSVGEQTGGLEEVLRNLADHIQRQSAAMGKLKQALTYPSVVFGLAIVVVVILATVVLPRITVLFERLGGEIPLPTMILMGVVDFLPKYGLHLFVGILGLALIGYICIRTPAGRHYRDVLLLKMPLLGRLIRLSEMSRCCRSIALLFRAGLPLPEVMSLTAEASSNQVVAGALREVEQDMLKGEGLAGPMRKRPIFLPLMVEMTKVGEETGNLDATLITAAENYEIEAESRTQTMLSMIEPAMTIAMGLGVGFIAVSVFLPLYSSLSLVGG